MSFESLEDFFSKLYNITDPNALSELAKVSTYYEVPKGTLFYQTGVMQVEIKLLVEGVARGFIHDENWNDKTDCFVVEPGWPLVGGVDFSQPSLKNVEALTDASIVAIPTCELPRLAALYPEVMATYNKLLSDAFLKIVEEKRIIDSYNAAERYQWFLEYYPGLSERIKQKHIASFLNITPVSLSRLKQQFKKPTDAKQPEILQETNIATGTP